MKPYTDRLGEPTICPRRLSFLGGTKRVSIEKSEAEIHHQRPRRFPADTEPVT